MHEVWASGVSVGRGRHRWEARWRDRPTQGASGQETSTSPARAQRFAAAGGHRLLTTWSARRWCGTDDRRLWYPRDPPLPQLSRPAASPACQQGVPRPGSGRPVSRSGGQVGQYLLATLLPPPRGFHLEGCDPIRRSPHGSAALPRCGALAMGSRMVRATHVAATSDTTCHSTGRPRMSMTKPVSAQNWKLTVEDAWFD